MESRQKRIRKIVEEYLQDGKERSVQEIRDRINKNGIELDTKSSALRIVLCNMKNEELLENPKMGKYRICRKTEVQSLKRSFGKYDFDDFELVKPGARKTSQLVFGVYEDGTISLNAKLLTLFPGHTVEIRIKKDCSEVALFLNGDNVINVGNNGRVKNYDILQRLKNNKIKLPVYYVGEWDEEEKVWIGKKQAYNPNCGEKHKKQ